MNSNRQFDAYVKEKFGDYTPGVHPRIWENIIAQKDKKRPAGFWVSMFNSRNKLLLLGLIIALSSGGAWFYYHQYVNSDTAPASAQNKNIEPLEKNKTGYAENTQTENEQTALTVNADNSSIAEKNAENYNPAYQLRGKLVAAISSPTPETDLESLVAAAAVGKNKKHITGLGNVLVNAISPALVEDADEFEGQGTLLGRLTYNAEKYTERRISGKPGKLTFNPILFLPDCPIEKDAAGNKRYFEFFAGPDYAIRNMHDTGNSNYLQKRKESTTFKSAYSAGVRYTKVFKNSMSVRGGVNYSQINEKFTFNQGNVIQVTYIINNNGDTIGSYTTTGTRHKTTINRYRSIDIPLVVGYELGNGKLHANINAGAIVNVYSWQYGDVLDTAGNPISITTGKGASPYQFKNNAGIGFIGAVSVYYKLNDRLHLMAEPYFRYNLSPMNKESITLKQKYQTAGLRLGIRLDLK